MADWTDAIERGGDLTALSVTLMHSARQQPPRNLKFSSIQRTDTAPLPSSPRPDGETHINVLTDVPAGSVYVNTSGSTRDGTPFVVLGARPNSGNPTSHFLASLGALHGRRWVACAKNKLWWMTPSWGEAGGAVPVETQFLLVEAGAGVYVCMLPLIYDGAFSGMLSGGNGVGKRASGWGLGSAISRYVSVGVEKKVF